MSGTHFFASVARRSAPQAIPLPLPLPAVTSRQRGLGAWLAEFWTLAGQAASIHASRKLLATMDDRMLADIGLTHAEARREAARPVWEFRR